MNFLTQRFRRLVSRSADGRRPENQPFDFIKSRNGILRELSLSRDSGNLVGLFSPALGEGMLLAVVQSIEPQGHRDIVVFTKYDIDGHLLSTGKVAVSEIRGICPFIKERRATVLIH